MTKRNFYFKLSSIVISGIITAGFILEIFSIKHFSLTYPYNLIVILVIVISLISTRIIFKKTFFFRWFSSLENSLVIIAAFILLNLISAFIPHQQASDGFINKLSLNKIINSYPFIFTYLYLIFTLGLVILRRINGNFSIRNIAFFLNHFGLWIILVGAGFGSADFVRLDMIVKLNNTVWYGYTEKDEIKELPFAIELKEFHMKTFTPKLQIIKVDSNLNNFKVIKQLQLDTIKFIRYKGIRIKTLQYVPYAWFINSDSVVQMKAPGYVNAAYVRIDFGDQVNEGWVSNSSLMQKGKYLPLYNGFYLTLSEPIPKDYISYIKVYTSNQEIFDTIVKVNKPVNVMGWNIYQKDYNKYLGEYSDYSVFEVNKDPWLWFVYSGIIMLAIGAIMLIFVIKY